MRPFPANADLQFLIGRSFGQIRLDPYSLQFLFEDGGKIMVESKIEHLDDDGSVHAYDCQNRNKEAIYLQNILQFPIVSVKAEPLCLSLTFSTGAVLRIFTEIGPYECGQIYSRKDRLGDFIVF